MSTKSKSISLKDIILIILTLFSVISITLIYFYHPSSLFDESRSRSDAKAPVRAPRSPLSKLTGVRLEDDGIAQNEAREIEQETSHSLVSSQSNTISKIKNKLSQRRGDLVCKGKKVDSEIIYWKVVEGDEQYESPITPHHNEHHEKYLTFAYDEGGWNNVRMSMHCRDATLITPFLLH